MQQLPLQLLPLPTLQTSKQQKIQISSEITKQIDQKVYSEPLIQITTEKSSQVNTQVNTQAPIQAIQAKPQIVSQTPPPKPKSRLKALFKAKPNYFLQPKVQKVSSSQQKNQNCQIKQTQMKRQQTLEHQVEQMNNMQPIYHDKGQFKNNKNIQLQQTSQDSKSEQSKKNKIIQPIKLQTNIKSIQPQISLETRKILAILDQKQSLLKSQSKQSSAIKKESQKYQIPTLQKSTQNQQSDKNNFKKCKHTGRHFKIYTPQHFQVNQNQQTKSSVKKWQFGTGQTPEQLLISSWNVNGIRARMTCNDIYPYLQSTKPDIFYQKSYEENPIKFWGYHSYWNYPKYSLGYSGVAIFSKHRALSMVQDILVPQHSKQGRVITLQFDKFVLVQAYIPTVGRQLQRLRYRVDQYDPAFRQYIKSLYSKYPNKTLIICGDLNVAHKELDCHRGVKKEQGIDPAFTFQERNSFSTLLKEAKLVDTFRHFYPNTRQYTWWNQRRGGRTRAGQTGIGKRLDYFLVDSQSLKFVKSSIIRKQVQGCDHCPIQLKLKFSSNQKNQ